MKILSARSVGGRVDSHEEMLEEGSTLIVVVRDPAETLELSEEQVNDSSAAIDEADRTPAR